MAQERDLEKSLEAAGKMPKPVQRPPKATPSQTTRPANVAQSLSPSTYRQAARQVEVVDAFEEPTAIAFGFLGSGQGGSRLANAHWRLGYRRVGIFNTTEMDFDGLSDDIPKLSLQVGGARKDAAFAEEQLGGRDEEVWDLLTRSWGNSVEWGLVCVGLGGGTGSGTCVPLIQLARKYLESHGKAARVGAIVSLPSKLEGQQVCRNAVVAFKKLLASNASPVIVIDNAKVQQLYRPPASELLPRSNFLVSSLLHKFNVLAATRSQQISFDASELVQLLDGRLVVMGAADLAVPEIKSPADISSKIRDELANNVLAQVDLRTGKKGACLFVASQEVLDTFSIDYFDAGFTQLNRLVGGSYDREKVPTVVHRGLYTSTEEGLQCYTMISELDPPYAKLAELAKEGCLKPADASSMATFLNVQD